MTLQELVSSIDIKKTYPGTQGSGIDIKVLTADSRAVVPSSLFVAIPGTGVDGHRFIPQAVEKGAVAVVCEHVPEDHASHPGVTWIEVADSSLAMGFLASQWYGNPSRELILVGVTGTNGKTTIATLLYEAWTARGVRSGLLSTVENRIGAEVVPSTHTTGDAMEINALMRRMVDAGCRFAAMEVSSHGAAQNRIAGLDFDGAIFTNLTRDHLDYHKTVDNYIRAKKKFFDNLSTGAWALVNDDDKQGRVMVQNTRARVSGYSLRSLDDFSCKVTEMRLDSTTMSINGIELTTRFTGRFNACNLTAVFGALVLMGVAPEDAAVTISALRPVCGRFETAVSADGVTVVVDYAHTPDAIANVLSAIRAVAPSAAITTVTGAGGNRDHGKRPTMGAEAAKLSARLIITSDNPRDEDPAVIAAAIAEGAASVSTGCRVDIVLDRAEAIRKAIAEAAPGDVVLVAGKGHETYQVFENGRTIHFDDHEQVRAALDARITK